VLEDTVSYLLWQAIRDTDRKLADILSRLLQQLHRL